MVLVKKALKNIVVETKGENAGYQHFLLFFLQQGFQSFWRGIPSFKPHFIWRLYISALSFGESKILSYGKELIQNRPLYSGTDSIHPWDILNVSGSSISAKPLWVVFYWDNSQLSTISEGDRIIQLPEYIRLSLSTYRMNFRPVHFERVYHMTKWMWLKIVGNAYILAENVKGLYLPTFTPFSPFPNDDC